MKYRWFITPFFYFVIPLWKVLILFEGDMMLCFEIFKSFKVWLFYTETWILEAGLSNHCWKQRELWQGIFQNSASFYIVFFIGTILHAPCSKIGAPSVIAEHIPRSWFTLFFGYFKWKRIWFYNNSIWLDAIFIKFQYLLSSWSQFTTSNSNISFPIYMKSIMRPSMTKTSIEYADMHMLLFSTLK